MWDNHIIYIHFLLFFIILNIIDNIDIQLNNTIYLYNMLLEI